MLKTVEDVERYLNSGLKLDGPARAKEYLSGRSIILIKKILQELGNPQQKLKVIHISGTSGKGSTAILAANLIASNTKAKTFLTVSPYIINFRERFQILNNSITNTTRVVSGKSASLDNYISNFLSEKKLAQYFNELDRLVFINHTISYFEKYVIACIFIANKEECQYMVIECGLGGLFDATNVFDNPDKINLINNIGYDHTNILGKDIIDISTHKAGIIKKGNTTIKTKQGSAINGLFENTCREKQSDLILVDQDPDPNITLAQEVAKQITGIKELENSDNIYLPGRFDIVRPGIIIDSAHNKQKFEYMWNKYDEHYNNTCCDIILSIKKGKNINTILSTLIGKNINTIHLYNNESQTQDTDSTINFESCEALEKKISSVLDVKVLKHKNIKTAIKHCISTVIHNHTNIIITGTTYILPTAYQQFFPEIFEQNFNIKQI